MSNGAHQRVFKIGLGFIVAGFTLCFLPLLLGHWDFNKYIVTVGAIALIVGINLCVQGIVDRWKRR